jgi:hypothetical protein
MSKKYTETPVAKLFSLSNQWGMLKQRAQSIILSNAIKRNGMLLFDAFSKFNYSKNGFLTSGETWSLFSYLEIEMTAQDILDFVQAADVDRDGNISYREFVEILQEPDKQLNNIEDEDDFQSIGSGTPREENSPKSPRHLNRSDSNIINTINQDFNIDISLLPVPSPVKLKKQFSMTIVQPKGEDILKELQNSIARQEEELEAFELALEGNINNYYVFKRFNNIIYIKDLI